MGLLNLLEIRGVLFPLLTFFNVFLTTQAHVAAWHKGKPILIVRFAVDLNKKTHIFPLTSLGMYCLNGTQPGVNDQNTNDAVQPLFMVLRILSRVKIAHSHYY